MPYQPSLIGGGGMGGYAKDFVPPQPPGNPADIREWLLLNMPHTATSLGMAPVDPNLPHDPILAGIGPAGTYTVPEQPAPPTGTPPATPPVTPPATAPDTASPLPTSGQPPAVSMPGVEAYEAYLREKLGIRDTANPQQDRADQFAERELKRTALLAQLAFASGVTASAGGSWKEVAKGFNNAGAIYDTGFLRYQTALQKGADRYQKMADQKYDDDTAIFTAAATLSMEQQKLAQKEREARWENLWRSLEGMKPDAGDYGSVDPNAQALNDARYFHGFNTGELLWDNHDVRD